MSAGPQAPRIVITGVGVVTSAGVGLEAHLARLAAAAPHGRDLSLTAFSPAPHLSDRRMLKSISAADAIGLVGIEDLRRHAHDDASCRDPWRTGLYVGSPPARINDNEFYLDAMSQTKDAAGRCSLSAFGETCMSARPTALLIGLPNNVLCYGAILLDARGANSNYTSVETSGHLAVVNAARRLRRGRLDHAVAGGFAAHGTAPYPAMFQKVGFASGGNERAGAVLADGAVFLALESAERAAARGASVIAELLAGELAADALGPLRVDGDGHGMETAVRKALASAGSTPDDVGLVLASGHGMPALDRGERAALTRIFEGSRAPALGTAARLFGNLMEAGGLIEAALIPPLYELGRLPSAMSLGPEPALIDAERPCALILRNSAWGEYSCLVIRRAP